MIPGLSFILGKWPWLAAGAVLGVFLSAGPVYLYGVHKGAVAERAAIEAQAAKDAFDRIQKMEKTNEEFRSLPAHERCLAFMRDSGLPDSACSD